MIKEQCGSMLLSNEICQQPAGHDGPCGNLILSNGDGRLWVTNDSVSIVDSKMTIRHDPHRVLKDALFLLIDAKAENMQYGGVDVGNGKKAYIRFSLEDDNEKSTPAT